MQNAAGTGKGDQAESGRVERTAYQTLRIQFAAGRRPEDRMSARHRVWGMDCHGFKSQSDPDSECLIITMVVIESCIREGKNS